jgi:hypothetical protein
MYDQLPALVGAHGVQPLTSAPSTPGPLLPLLASSLRAPLDVALELTCAAAALVAAAAACSGCVHGIIFLLLFAAFHTAQSAFGTFTQFQVQALCRPATVHRDSITC